MKDWNSAIFNVNEQSFAALALEIFAYQYEHLPLYQSYCNYLQKSPANVADIESIPFLPIEFFKSNKLISMEREAELIFESSGTTGSIPSRHYVGDKRIYECSFRNYFTQRYGSVKDYCVLGLLPSYLERSGSSLVYMVRDLINESEHSESGFYLYEFEQLAAVIQALEAKKQPTVLIGVTYALLDFAAEYSFPLACTTIIETGGMKGRKEELTREEVHSELKRAFQVPTVHSEYGMTELLSQAYSSGVGLFNSPAWMRVLIRDVTDPFAYLSADKTGGMNVIDLANIYSCSFIATSDLGMIKTDGTFEVSGRFDAADVRGCSLLYST